MATRFGGSSQQRPYAMGGNGVLSPESLPRRQGSDYNWRRGTAWFGGAGTISRDLEGIPSWDGTAARWRRYKKDVALWIEGINLDVSWSWAARMVRCLTGPAKTLGESIPMEELRAKPRTRVPEPSTRAGEDLNAWMIRFGEACGQLDEESVSLPATTAGWRLIEKTGLSDAQKSMLMTSTAGSMELRDVVPAMLRVFPNPHHAERRAGSIFDRRRALTFGARSGHGAGGGTTLVKKKLTRKSVKEAHLTEDVDGLSDDDDTNEALNAELGSEGDADDEVAEDVEALATEQDLEGILASELEALSTVLEEAEEDPELVKSWATWRAAMRR